MIRITRLCDWACRALAGLAALLLAALFLLGLAELLSRNILGGSISFATEYTGYLVASVMLLGLGACLADGGHIRVSLLAGRVSPQTGRTLDLIATLWGLIIAAAWAWAQARYAWGSFAGGERSFFPSETPLWLPQALLALGPGGLTLALLARALRLFAGIQPAADKAME